MSGIISSEPRAPAIHSAAILPPARLITFLISRAAAGFLSSLLLALSVFLRLVGTRAKSIREPLRRRHMPAHGRSPALDSPRALLQLPATYPFLRAGHRWGCPKSRAETRARRRAPSLPRSRPHQPPGLSGLRRGGSRGAREKRLRGNLLPGERALTSAFQPQGNVGRAGLGRAPQPIAPPSPPPGAAPPPSRPPNGRGR